jgi:hypothetical protein
MLDGLYVQQGHEAFTSLYSLHRNSLHFPDSEMFVPKMAGHRHWSPTSSMSSILHKLPLMYWEAPGIASAALYARSIVD